MGQLEEIMPITGYDWNNTWETDRRYEEGQPDARDRRSPFEHDRSRIIHSVAFRRLQGKTQVFAPGWADFLRTRVTHTIEAAQIGRALADNAGIPGSLVEAACLAHDLGHPPFGHTGEAALNDLMHEHGGFEGNAQTFRILTRLERKSDRYPGGLNLCRATLLGVLKYPYAREAGSEKFLYREDALEYEGWLFQDTEHELGRSLVHGEQNEPPRTIVCSLMDWADDVAYSVHDLEDGLLSGFLLPSLFLEERFIDSIHKNLQTAPIKSHPSRDRVKEVLGEVAKRLGGWKPAPSMAAIREVTRHYINRFVVGVEVNATNPIKTSFNAAFHVPPELREECAILKALTFEFIIRDERTTTFAYKGREIVRRIFEALHANTAPKAKKARFELFPRDLREELEKAADSTSDRGRLTCDYVASMTDGQAIRLFRRLFEPTGGSPFESV